MDLDQKIAALKKLPAGFALTPVKNKIPLLTAWEKTDTTRDEIAAYLKSGQATGFGLRTGISSGGICAIDIDGTAAQCKLIDVMGDEEMPPTIAFASGKPDRSQYLFLVPQDLWDTLKTKSEKITTGETDGKDKPITEEFAFFWNCHQSVLPPSSHPETDGYYWIHSPDEVEIALIPDKLLAHWQALINPPVVTEKTVYKKPTKVLEKANTDKNIPLERFLTIQHRSDLDGVVEPGRNVTGASLARDLIGVANLGVIECDYKDKNYTLTIVGDAEDLFNNYCDSCSPIIDDAERQKIWNSAQKADGEPCIRDEEMLKNCARSYLKEILPKQERLTKKERGKTINHGLEFRSSVEDGLWFIEKTFDKQTAKIIETEHYIGNHLIGIARVKSTTGDGAAIYLEFKTYEDTIGRWLMPRAATQFETPQMLAELLSRGYYFSLSMKKAFLEYLSALKIGIEKTYTITEQTGWVGKNYVSQNKTYSVDNKSDLIFRDVEPIVDSISEIKGTLQGWQTNIGAKCAGNSRLIFVTGVAVAAPLQALLNIESGGFHLVGITGVGKTTILKVMASVLGIKDLPQWRTTTNGLESVAYAHNNMALPMDEIGQADPREVGLIAYMLANGQGKTRMNKNLTNRKAKTWQLLFLSSGEMSMGAYMALAGIAQKGGQEVRMPDIPAACTGSQYGAFENIHGYSTSKEFAENLDAATKLYRGTLLDAFLERLVIDVVDDFFLDKWKQRLREISVKLATGTADNAVSRVANRFALIQVGLELAHSYGLLPFPITDIEWAIDKMFVDWLNCRGGDGSIEMRSAVNRIQHLFVSNEYSDRMFIPPTNGGMKVRNLLAYRKVDANSMQTEEFWVPPSVFDAEICEGMNKSELIAELQRLKIMPPPRSDGSPKYQRKIESKASYYYIFRHNNLFARTEAAEAGSQKPDGDGGSATLGRFGYRFPTPIQGGVGEEVPLQPLQPPEAGAEAGGNPCIVDRVIDPFIHSAASAASDTFSPEKKEELTLLINALITLTGFDDTGALDALEDIKSVCDVADVHAALDEIQTLDPAAFSRLDRMIKTDDYKRIEIGDRVRCRVTGIEGVLHLWHKNRVKAIIQYDDCSMSDWIIETKLVKTNLVL